MTLKVNFIIYSASLIPLNDSTDPSSNGQNGHSAVFAMNVPTHLDSGFDRTVQLCYYGNHYDSVVTVKKHAIETYCQGSLPIIFMHFQG
jgi:hypothetical protein